jgi:NAD(P)-dependent dehydrogenase (short-subunit alcohol dehydrogenase family)
MKPEVVLITGCSTGIGRATAATLTAAGYEVVATARRFEDLQGIGAAMILPLDVTDEASIEAAVEAVLERYGRIDVLVNNAGYALRGAVEELEIAAVQRMFDVNVHGIIRLVRAVAPRCVPAGRAASSTSAPSPAGSPRRPTLPMRPRSTSACAPCLAHSSAVWAAARRSGPGRPTRRSSCRAMRSPIPTASMPIARERCSRIG